MKEIENEFVKFWLKDGIMFGEYKPNKVVTIDAAKRIADDRIQLSENKSLPNLVFISNLSSVTKEARDYFSKGPGMNCISKLALITTSPIGRVTGNFFLQINKPITATKLFTSVDEAVKWLKEV